MSTNSVPARFLLGNLALILCCGCYLLWWILAFNPVSPLRGAKSGWLLIPAFFAGLLGIVVIIWTGTHAVAARRLFVPWRLVVVGVVGYLVLLLVTRLVFNRQVTAELFLMVGWSVLMLYEINALYGAGVFGRQPAVTFAVVILAVLLVCLVCYTLYYRLGGPDHLTWSGLVDGCIPLVLGAVMAAAISVGSLGR